MKRFQRIFQDKKFLRIFFFAVAFSLLHVTCFAQLDDPGGGAGDPDVPVDGGVSLLLAAGVGYGAKQLRKANANKSKKEKE